MICTCLAGLAAAPDMARFTVKLQPLQPKQRDKVFGLPAASASDSLRVRARPDCKCVTHAEKITQRSWPNFAVPRGSPSGVGARGALQVPKRRAPSPMYAQTVASQQHRAVYKAGGTDVLAG